MRLLATPSERVLRTRRRRLQLWRKPLRDEKSESM